MTIQTDGFPTKIQFSSAQLSSGVVVADIMEEQEVTPPGVAGGGANDTTSMRNTLWRTNHPKKLVTLTPFTVVIKYDPVLFDQMVAMINDNQEMTIIFPDLAELVFWAWIDEFTPNAQTEGAQPTANISIIPSNMDADNNNAEIAPNFTLPPS